MRGSGEYQQWSEEVGPSRKRLKRRQGPKDGANPFVRRGTTRVEEDQVHGSDDGEGCQQSSGGSQSSFSRAKENATPPQSSQVLNNSAMNVGGIVVEHGEFDDTMLRTPLYSDWFGYDNEAAAAAAIEKGVNGCADECQGDGNKQSIESPNNGEQSQHVNAGGNIDADSKLKVVDGHAVLRDEHVKEKKIDRSRCRRRLKSNTNLSDKDFQLELGNSRGKTLKSQIVKYVRGAGAQSNWQNLQYTTHYPPIL